MSHRRTGVRWVDGLIVNLTFGLDNMANRPLPGHRGRFFCE